MVKGGVAVFRGKEKVGAAIAIFMEESFKDLAYTSF